MEIDLVDKPSMHKVCPKHPCHWKDEKAVEKWSLGGPIMFSTVLDLIAQRFNDWRIWSTIYIDAHNSYYSHY